MVRAALILILFSFAASAQQSDTGVAIAEFSAGGIFGLGAHGSVGGNIGAPISRFLVPYVDFSYSPLTTYSYNYGSNLTGKALYSSSVLDANGGVRIRFAGRRSDWVPYIGVGGGVLHFTSSDETSGFSVTQTIKTSNNELAVNGSIGALYYVTQHVGFGIEAKGYEGHPRRFAQGTMGVFYQFP